MNRAILLLEDEPLILMDLEFAAQDLGCTPLATPDCEEAISLIRKHEGELSVAVLDVSLGEGNTCFPVANELEQRGIPYILHSGDLDRHDEKIRELRATLIAKPAPANHVIETAIAHAGQR